MSPKLRTRDKHLPPRVYFKHGKFFYVTKENKWIMLGKTMPEAMANWTKLIDRPTHITTMNTLFDRYMLEVAPLKSARTYKTNIAQVQKLRLVFGDMQPADITPVDIYKYMDTRKQLDGRGAVSANREKALLSHIFSMAIRWGALADNPCRHVKRHTEHPRNRYITDEEYLIVRSIAPLLIQLAMDFAYLTGQRIGDILKIRLSDLTEEGISIEQEKSIRMGRPPKKILIGWSDELRQCVELIRKIPRTIRGLYLFCSKQGQRYTSDGFSTMWQRVITKAVATVDDNGNPKEPLLKEGFHFHDIRAKAASDAKDGNHARELLGHANIAITNRVYRRKIELVRPVR
jgi:integrase